MPYSTTGFVVLQTKVAIILTFRLVLLVEAFLVYPVAVVIGYIVHFQVSQRYSVKLTFCQVGIGHVAAHGCVFNKNVVNLIQVFFVEVVAHNLVFLVSVSASLAMPIFYHTLSPLYEYKNTKNALFLVYRVKQLYTPPTF